MNRTYNELGLSISYTLTWLYQYNNMNVLVLALLSPVLSTAQFIGFGEISSQLGPMVGGNHAQVNEHLYSWSRSHVFSMNGTLIIWTVKMLHCFVFRLWQQVKKWLCQFICSLVGIRSCSRNLCVFASCFPSHKERGKEGERKIKRMALKVMKTLREE